jgi:hypothetical protein
MQTETHGDDATQKLRFALKVPSFLRRELVVMTLLEHAGQPSAMARH